MESIVIHFSVCGVKSTSTISDEICALCSPIRLPDHKIGCQPVWDKKSHCAVNVIGTENFAVNGRELLIQGCLLNPSLALLLSRPRIQDMVELHKTPIIQDLTYTRLLIIHKLKELEAYVDYD